MGFVNCISVDRNPQFWVVWILDSSGCQFIHNFCISQFVLLMNTSQQIEGQCDLSKYTLCQSQNHFLSKRISLTILLGYCDLRVWVSAHIPSSNFLFLYFFSPPWIFTSQLNHHTEKVNIGETMLSLLSEIYMTE